MYEQSKNWWLWKCKCKCRYIFVPSLLNIRINIFKFLRCDFWILHEYICYQKLETMKNQEKIENTTFPINLEYMWANYSPQAGNSLIGIQPHPFVYAFFMGFVKLEGQNWIVAREMLCPTSMKYLPIKRKFSGSWSRSHMSFQKLYIPINTTHSTSQNISNTI